MADEFEDEVIEKSFDSLLGGGTKETIKSVNEKFTEEVTKVIVELHEPVQLNKSDLSPEFESIKVKKESTVLTLIANSDTTPIRFKITIPAD